MPKISPLAHRWIVSAIAFALIGMLVSPDYSVFFQTAPRGSAQSLRHTSYRGLARLSSGKTTSSRSPDVFACSGPVVSVFRPEYPFVVRLPALSFLHLTSIVQESFSRGPPDSLPS